MFCVMLIIPEIFTTYNIWLLPFTSNLDVLYPLFSKCGLSLVVMIVISDWRYRQELLLSHNTLPLFRIQPFSSIRLYSQWVICSLFNSILMIPRKILLYLVIYTISIISKNATLHWFMILLLKKFSRFRWFTFKYFRILRLRCE